MLYSIKLIPNVIDIQTSGNEITGIILSML